MRIMDIDELKHTWSFVDKYLEKRQLTDSTSLSHLADTFRHVSDARLRRIAHVQRLSILTGTFTLALLVVITCLIIMKNRIEYVPLTICVAVSLLWGIWWDNKTHRLIKSIRVDTMPVAEVVKRTAVLYHRMKKEVWIASGWTVAFTTLFYYIMGYWQLSPLHQTFLGVVFVLLNGSIIYFLYKKLIYNHLYEIKRSEKDLKDLKDI